MTPIWESIKSQIRPSAPISRKRHSISLTTRALLRTGARFSSSARLSRAADAAALASSSARPIAVNASASPVSGAACLWSARLALFYGAVFGLTGPHLPFFPVWLKAVGIDASWIGIITAVPAVTRFTVLPLVTGLAERRGSLRGAMIVTAFMTALGFSVVGTQHQALLVLAAYVATACMWTPMVPLTDAYALRGVARYGLNYGPLRLWGSAAVVVGAPARGRLCGHIPPQKPYPVPPSLGAPCGLPPPRPPPPGRPKTPTP